MSETGREPAPRSARARLQESYRLAAQSARAQPTRASSPVSTVSLFASPTSPSASSSSSTPSGRSASSGRSTTELWPGQAAQDAAREAARAQGAAPPGGYRPSAYQDQYLAAAALEPFVYPLPRPGASPDTSSTPSTDPGSLASVLSDRRVVDLGAGAVGAGAEGAGAEGAATTSGGVDRTDAADPFEANAASSFTRPGHQPVAGSIFAAPDQHAATGSLFAEPDGPQRVAPLLPAGAPSSPVQPVLAVDHDGADGDEDAPTEGEPPRSRRGRTIALVGGILTIVAAGAGGAFAYSALGGGGPQPETALPSTTVAFVKVDLDPSAGQKVDAVRFLRAFPAARDRVDEKSDLREVAFTALQKEGRLAGVDYDTQVAPWLGQRLGLGVVPATSPGGAPIPVLALAVSDAAQARQHLPELASALGGACQVVEEFAICTRGKDGGDLDAVLTATARGSLADSATFRQDMFDLGEDGIIAGWVDSAKAADVVGTLPFLGARLEEMALGGAPGATAGPSSAPADPVYADAGRTAIALRFDGPHLELAGHTNGAKAPFVGRQHVTGVTSLPWDSLAAVSIANGGDQLRAVWPELEKGLGARLAGSATAPGASSAGSAKGTAATGKGAALTGKGAAAAPLPVGPLASLQDVLGITVPEDLYAALGSQFTVVFGGIEERNGQPKAALVGNGDQVVLGKLAKSAQAIGGQQLTLLPSPGRSVLATSDEYGQEIVTGSGLGDMPGFTDAVEGVDDARAVVYLDIAGLVSQFKDEMDPKDVADLANLSALGITVSGEGTSADFRVRLTTK